MKSSLYVMIELLKNDWCVIKIICIHCKPILLVFSHITLTWLHIVLIYFRDKKNCCRHSHMESRNTLNSLYLCTPCDIGKWDDSFSSLFARNIWYSINNLEHRNTKCYCTICSVLIVSLCYGFKNVSYYHFTPANKFEGYQYIGITLSVYSHGIWAITT